MSPRTLGEEVCRRLGVHKTRTSPLHPQSDGWVERVNRTLATQLAILTSQRWQPLGGIQRPSRRRRAPGHLRDDVSGDRVVVGDD